MEFSQLANTIFRTVIQDYHIADRVDQSCRNPYSVTKEQLSYLLYQKCWIDTIQWHYEDLIRDPLILPQDALQLKRQIDASNQDRTDIVEAIDEYFLTKYTQVVVKDHATFNTESPAWGVDRLSILALKIYHMREEATRDQASTTHRQNCKHKLAILLAQQKDLSKAIDTLLEDIARGDKYMKVYKQMKMYNDEEMNPILRARK